LPTSQYKPGVPPPAHLSPFIDNEKEGYVPLRQKEIMHLKGEDVVESEEDEDEPMVEEKKQKPTKEKAEKTKETKEEEPVNRKGDADSSSEEEEESDDDKPIDMKQLAANKKKANAKIKQEIE
jgi:pescadillo protein